MAVSFPRGGFPADDFFAPFFTGFPDMSRELTRALAPLEGQSTQLATRGVPIDVVSARMLGAGCPAAFVRVVIRF
jgi:hypothetical protein